MSRGYLFGLFTDALCIIAAGLLVSLATGNLILGMIANVAIATLLWWWRGR